MSKSEKRLSVKSLIILTAVLPVVVILLSSVAIILTAGEAQVQTIFDMTPYEERECAISSLPDSNKAAFDFVVESVNAALETGLLNHSGNVYVEISEITSDNEALQKILSFAASSFAEKMSEKAKPVSVKYGGDVSFIKNLLPGNEPSDFLAEATDGKVKIELIYDKIYSNMCYLDDDKAQINTFIFDNKEVFDVSPSTGLLAENVVYEFIFDEMSGEIEKFAAYRKYNFSSELTFRDSLSGIGKASLGMSVLFADEHYFSYAGIKIEEELVTITPDSEATLTVIPFTEAELREDEYSLKFVSSDEKAVTVDENGIVTGIAESKEPVKVSVVLNYLGREFTDTCLVYCVNEVSSVNISETELTMKKNESHKFTAEIKPDEATVRDVMFFSSDESIVKISEDGVAVAVKEGAAVIYAVSVQGHVAASCGITVTA